VRMIIECPSCSSRYRIKEEKLPDGGGNIKCPNCAHVFFVARPGGPAPPLASTDSVSGPDTNGWSQIPMGSQGPPVPSQPDHTLALSAPPVAAAPSPGPPIVSGMFPVAPGTPLPKKWKLKNAVGLVYDFTDTEQIVRWLGSKDSHDGFEASDDNGATFRGLADCLELVDVRPARSKTMMGMAPISISQVLDSGQSVATGTTTANNSSTSGTNLASSAGITNRDMQQQAKDRLDQARKARGIADAPAPQAPAPRPAASRQVEPKPGSARLKRAEEPKANNNGIILASVIILPLLVLVALNMLEVINLRALFGASPRGSYGQGQANGVYGPNDSEGSGTLGSSEPRNSRIELTEEQQIARLIDLAGAAYAARDYESAIGHLERASFLEPENIELKCQLADIYERADRPADAARTQALCDAGKNEASGEGSAVPSQDLPVDPSQDAPAEPSEEAPVEPPSE